jgi:hypothetical protein
MKLHDKSIESVELKPHVADSDIEEQPQKPEAGFYHQYKKQYQHMQKNNSPLVKSNIKTDDSERLLTKRTSID